MRRLDLFDSAATGSFDSARSDVDLLFLVEFDDDPARLFDRYFGLKDSLEALLRRLVYALEDAQAA